MKGVYDVFSLNVDATKRCGVAEVSAFSLTDKDCFWHNLHKLSDGYDFATLRGGQYVRLVVDNVLMMSDTDMEKRTNRIFIEKAHGDVMIAGLGIGLILRNLEDKVKSGEVTSITIYEKYQDVIDLVAPYYKHLPLVIKCADILEYVPPKEETYDTIYFDIWPTISTDNLADIRKLHNRWKFHKRPNGWMDSWMKKFLQNERAKDNRSNGYFWF